MSDRLIVWTAATVLVVIGAFTYANTLSNPFLFDDEFAIAKNESMRDLGDLRAVLSPPAESPVAGRPLVNLSLAINYAIGGYDVRGYHVVNIALHLACALLVFGIVGSVRLQPDYAAFAIALLWIVHPLNSEVVDYLTERTESMMAVCFLLALYACIRAAGRTVGASVWPAVAILASAAGMACKESMATLPMIVALYDRAFLFDSWQDALRRRWPLYAGLAATWVPLGLLLAARPRTWSSGFATAVVSPWTYLLNQAVMIPRYLRLALWPDSLVLNYGWARPLTLGDVWPGALLVVCLLILTVRALVRHPKIGFLWAWVFITLAPTSSFVPIGAEVGAERRMYLPTIAIVTLAVVVLGLLTRRFAPEGSPRRGAWLAALSTAFIVTTSGFIVTTRARNLEYRSPLTMAGTVLARWPTPVAHHMVGTELARAGRHDEAIAHLRQAVDGYPPGRYALGLEAFELGLTDEAIAELQRFLQDEPGSPSTAPARITLGQAFERGRRWADAAEQYGAVVAANPADFFAHRRLADALFEEDRFAEAVTPYRVFLDHGTGDAATWHRYGESLTRAGRPADALAAFRRAVTGEPANARYRVSLAGALLAAGDAGGALHQAEEAVRLDPADREAQELLRRLR